MIIEFYQRKIVSSVMDHFKSLYLLVSNNVYSEINIFFKHFYLRVIYKTELF